jgi:hypothetical protein
MLNKSVSSDKAVATLINELGPWAGLTFSWLIAHLDREGRMHGDPEVIKGLVFPRIAGIDPAIIRQTLGRAHELGLIRWYEADGDAYLEMPGFEKNQVGMRKDREPESSVPAPTSVVPQYEKKTSLPEDCRQTSGNLPSEGKGREVEVKDMSSSTRRVEKSDEIQAVFAHYRTLHPRAHPKPKSGSPEWRKIRDRLAEGYTVEALKQAIDGCHKSKFHQGENDSRTKYLDLELIVRSSTHVAKFIELADPKASSPPRPARQSNILPDSERVHSPEGLERIRQITGALR